MIEKYDKIAKQYIKTVKRPTILREYCLTPSLFYPVGDIKGKTILDLGCGEGYFTRLMKKKGASKVIGVDISKEMIKLARASEKREPLGIKYFVYDTTQLPKLDEFDIVMGTFLLHYSKTETQILKMCKNIYKNLKDGGRFIALNHNPDNPIGQNKKYGSTTTAKKPLKEGDILTVTLFSRGKKTCSFGVYFWKKGTYEKAFKRAGFKIIKWHKLIISREGIKKFGRIFWEDYLEKPTKIVIECIK